MISSLSQEILIILRSLGWSTESWRIPPWRWLNAILVTKHGYRLYIVISVVREPIIICGCGHQFHLVLSFRIVKKLSREFAVLQGLLSECTLRGRLGLLLGWSFYTFWIGLFVGERGSHEANPCCLLEVRRVWDNWLLMNRSLYKIEGTDGGLIRFLIMHLSYLHGWVLIEIFIRTALQI